MWSVHGNHQQQVLQVIGHGQYARPPSPFSFDQHNLEHSHPAGSARAQPHQPHYQWKVLLDSNEQSCVASCCRWHLCPAMCHRAGESGRLPPLTLFSHPRPCSLPALPTPRPCDSLGLGDTEPRVVSLVLPLIGVKTTPPLTTDVVDHAPSLHSQRMWILVASASLTRRMPRHGRCGPRCTAGGTGSCHG